MTEVVVETYAIQSGRRSCIKPITCKSCPLASKLKIDPDLTDYKKVLLFGENPGREERIKMKPFTGPSGQLLRQLLEDTGAALYGVGLSNVCLCEGMKDLEGDALDDAIDACSNRFWNEIEALKPELLVAAGDLARSVLLPELDRRSVGSTAGELFNFDNYNILAVHHPAYILRYAKMFTSYWDEINSIRLFFAERPGSCKVEFGNLASISYLHTCPEISIDTETTSYSPFDSERGITWNGRYYTRGELLCLGLSGDGKTSYIFTPITMKRYLVHLKVLLEQKPVICHNGQFDIPFLNKHNIFPKLKDDTMLMSYSMDESPRHPLKRLARRHLGLEDWSTVLDEYLPNTAESYAAIPPELLYHYNGLDTSATYELKQVLDSKMTEDDRSIYETVLIPCANMFIAESHRGIRIDILRLMDLKKVWEVERHELLMKLKAFGVANPRSPFQVSHILRKLDVVDFDAVTLKKNLEILIPECRSMGNDRGIEFIETIIAYREIQLALNTFLREVATGMSLLDGKYHPDFKLFGTVTGRLTEHILLNFPKSTQFSEGLRSIFIPEPGYVWGHWDQKNFELRVYAVINDDETMKDLFTPRKGLPFGRDPHGEVGHLVYGNDYERLNKESLGFTRTAIKAIVFGKLYGRGDLSIASQIGWSVEDAALLGIKVEDMFPGVPRYKRMILDIVNEKQELVNPLGRRRRFPIITNDNYHKIKNEAFNFPVQSTANDLNLLGMLRVHDFNNPDLVAMFPIHDAIEFQIKESRLQALEELITSTLKGVPEHELAVSDIVFATTHKVGDDWAEASVE